MLTYPEHPGFKVSGPSQEAAEKIEPKAKTMRAKVVDVFAKQNPRDGFTADEVALILNASVLSIRPRFSELVRSSVLEDTGLRRENEFKSKITVWRLK